MAKTRLTMLWTCKHPRGKEENICARIVQATKNLSSE